ncbi:MAG: MFS transporter [Bacteroidia bacterium]|nr:MFS transporter [Bacteroidia bacterium]
MKKKPDMAPLTAYQKFIVAVIAFIQFTVVLDFMILSPLGDILMKSMDITPSKFAFVVSSYAFSAGISGILAAGFADRFDRKKLLMFFYTGFIIGTMFCGLANTFESLLAARIFTGLFGGVIASIGMAIITDLFEIQQRGRVMGITQMSFAASQILGIPVGLYLATKWNWHVAFFMIVAVAIAVGLVMLLKMKPIAEHLKLRSDKSAFDHLIHTAKNKTYQIGFMATAMLSIGGFMLMPFGSAFLVNNVGIPQDQIQWVFLFTGISSIIIMPIIGRLSDRVDKFKIFTVGSVWAIIMVIVYTNIGVTPLWLVTALNMLLFMGIMSRMVPSTILATAIPDMKDRGAFMSINSSLQQMAGGLSAVIAGLIVHQQTKTSPIEHYDILGYVVSFVILICIYFLWKVSEVVKKKEIENLKNPIGKQ